MCKTVMPCQSGSRGNVIWSHRSGGIAVLFGHAIVNAKILYVSLVDSFKVRNRLDMEIYIDKAEFKDES